jgi:hypothetical protein
LLREAHADPPNHPGARGANSVTETAEKLRRRKKKREESCRVKKSGMENSI